MYQSSIVRKIGFLTLITVLGMLSLHTSAFADAPDLRNPVRSIKPSEIQVTSREMIGTIVGDGGFEAGTPNPEWEEFSIWFDTPICDIDFCGLSGETGPHTGNWWAWFGGTVDQETGIITQTVTIPSGAAALTFWLAIPSAQNNGFLSVRMDGTELFRVEENTPGYGTYSEVTVDISAYANGSAHELVFFGTTDANPQGVTNFFVDDVAITPTAPTAVHLSNFDVISPSSNTINLTFLSIVVLAGTIIALRRW